jgi:16S rRNA (cytosine967-C5)-methyltransferase
VLETQQIACSIVAAVGAGRNLNAVLAEQLARHSQLTPQQRGAVSDLSYGTLRFGHRLDVVLAQLLNKPLQDAAVRWLLLVALYQLEYTRAAQHAVVDHAVRCATALGHPQAGGLVNAVLRNFLRKRAEVLARAAQSEVGRFAFPQWWITRTKNQYPQRYAEIFEACNTHPPLTLRVNCRRTTVAGYLAVLAHHDIAAQALGAAAIRIEQPVPVERLPGFADGLVSVQDAGAQLAAPLLDVEDGMRVLDACAAPGGKTTHLLERAAIELIALDSDASRLERVRQNLARLQFDAKIVSADALELDTWWDGIAFDRVLADLPCSASGVVRRHPDIKWLRRAGDIARFVAQQRALLDALWQVLASGGKLLYATCSVFEEENSRQIGDFLARHADARRLSLSPSLSETISMDGIPEGQLLPDNEHDGFFYALLQKN